MKNNFGSQSGQVGVIVLLTMTGMLALGLSLASRTTQESLLSGKEVVSTRVFNAAEQGIEEALGGDLDFEGDSFTGDFELSGLGVDYTIKKINQLETRLFEGISVEVDVTGASDGNVLEVVWSKVDNCATEDPASLIASIYYDDNDAGITRVRHEALGACDRADGFTLASVVNQDGYRRSYNLPLQTDDFLVRLKSVYNDTHIRVASGDFTMPVQYYSIRSQAANSDSNETRIVQVNRTIESAPTVLDYAVYSGNTLIK